MEESVFGHGTAFVRLRTPFVDLKEPSFVLCKPFPGLKHPNQLESTLFWLKGACSSSERTLSVMLERPTVGLKGLSVGLSGPFYLAVCSVGLEAPLSA